MIHRTPPRPGVCIEVDLVRVIDGDTVVVTSRLSGREFAVRFEGIERRGAKRGAKQDR